MPAADADSVVRTKLGFPTCDQRPPFLALLPPAGDLFLQGLGQMSDFSSVSFIHKYFFSRINPD